MRIEVPAGSFVKRSPDGRVDFRAPLPSPFNYGSVVGTLAPDGDPEDAVVLGPRLAIGDEIVTTVRGTVDFLDDGLRDPKLICAARPLSVRQRWTVRAFFRGYAVAKAAINRWRGKGGRTAYRGFDG